MNCSFTIMKQMLQKGRFDNMTLFKHEIKMNLKSMIIWTTCIGIICAGCIMLFDSLENTMSEMADTFAQMGAFSAALGLDKVSISTIDGFYATEIAIIFAIGGAMFASMTGVAILSKEEEGHTAEFLHTLPFGRSYILGWKYAAVAASIFLFNMICIIWIIAGFAAGQVMPDVKNLVLYHVVQFFMQLEIGSICFLISAFCKRKQMGAALGFAVLMYLFDMLCRVIPDMDYMKYITPYYYANASDIFTDGSIDMVLVCIGIGITVVCVAASLVVYGKKDLAA